MLANSHATLPDELNEFHTHFEAYTAECQNGWTLFGSRCFRIFTAAANWTDSEQNCVTMGGHLASVHSSKEYIFIQDLVLNATNSTTYTWLGGSDSAQEGVWVWTDGSAFNYSSWDSGQPDNHQNIENCLIMNWGDTFYTITATSTAEPSTTVPSTTVPSTTVPSLPKVFTIYKHAGCQGGWSQFGSRCFRTFTAADTWNASEQKCVAVGGHLASVHSSSEYAFLQNLVLNTTNSNARTWIGGTDAAQYGVWVWTDGSVFDYSNWGDGQPDYLGYENCLEMNFSWITYYSGPSAAVPLTTVPSSVINGTSGPTSPENVLVMRLKVNSVKDLMASNSSQLFLQQLKGTLIDRGLPNNFTLHLRSISKKSP
ncbi:macrophage mannose receptor 1-like [Salminus brasiliensis]|uniref:macrophage mannose receptor 1-like n=1 Tax=Salminus brasiliensis TaxID=930266 RepID=UPI003B8317D0